MGIQKYFTEEERLEARRKQLREAGKRWRKKNPEKDKESKRQWRENNPDYRKRWHQENLEKEKDYQKEYNKEYLNTPMGRAANLVKNYQQNDKKYNRGECTLTAQWVVDNIFNKPCHYNCGETDWKKIGCDRINNDLPHTPDNVVPCCTECNKKRGTKTYEEFLMSLSGIN